MMLSKTDSSRSSDWQSCSEEALSAQTSHRTLNLRPDDPSTHEPPNVVCRLLDQLAAGSNDSSRKDQPPSSTSLDRSRSRTNSNCPNSDKVDPQLGIPSAFALGDASRPVFLLPTPTYHVGLMRYPANFAGMDTINVPELVERLGSEEDAVRKMAVFKLQSNIGDPSFAEIFIQDGGLQKLKYLTMHATGNTLAYSLTSFSRLLEVDKGWDFVQQDLIQRVRSQSPARPHFAYSLLG